MRYIRLRFPKIYATNLIVREYPCLFSMGNGIGLACMYGTQNKYG